MQIPYVLAITGASGAAYAVRLLEVLLASGKHIHLTISPSAAAVFKVELGLSLDLDHFEPAQLEGVRHHQSAGQGVNRTSTGRTPAMEGVAIPGTLTYHHYQDFSAGIASGSFQTAGMVICPCSMGTLASVAHGLSTNLIQRAADVHLKERRKLIVVPRETPLGSIQLQNMKMLADAGGVILPAMPGFYHQPETIHDLVDFVVARICDQLGVSVELIKRWGREAENREIS